MCSNASYMLLNDAIINVSDYSDIQYSTELLKLS